MLPQESLSYQGLVDASHNENTRRATAVEQSQPVYGPPHLSESDFFDLLLGDRNHAAQTRLVEQGQLDHTETGARAYRTHVSEFPGTFDPLRGHATLSWVRAQYSNVIDDVANRVTAANSELIHKLPRFGCVGNSTC